MTYKMGKECIHDRKSGHKLEEQQPENHLVQQYQRQRVGDGVNITLFCRALELSSVIATALEIDLRW